MIDAILDESAQVTEEMWQYLLERVRRMSRPLVIYHGGCKDGFGAAWVFHRQFGDNAQYDPASYGSEPPDVKGRDVYIVDFSYPRAILEKMNADARSLRVLDHHKTAQADLEGLPYCTFDMGRSGAGLAWDFIHKGKERHSIVNYVEDRDLWRFALPDSREINAYLQTLPYDFSVWDHVATLDMTEIRDLGIEFMRVRNDNNKNNIAILMSRHLFHGYEQIPIINAPTEGISELMEEMLKQTNAPFAVAWRIRADGRLSLSFRSVGDMDVSLIAKAYGGGGHKNAAGVELRHTLALTLLSDLIYGVEQK